MLLPRLVKMPDPFSTPLHGPSVPRPFPSLRSVFDDPIQHPLSPRTTLCPWADKKSVRLVNFRSHLCCAQATTAQLRLLRAPPASCRWTPGLTTTSEPSSQIPRSRSRCVDRESSGETEKDSTLNQVLQIPRVFRFVGRFAEVTIRHLLCFGLGEIFSVKECTPRPKSVACSSLVV